MLASLYAKLASFFLSKIIPSIDTKQVSSQNKDGLVMLENLEINPILLIKERIPFNIQRGIIKSMKISIDPLPNGLAISCNDLILFCDSQKPNFFEEKDSQNFILNLKAIFYHFFSRFASSIGTLFDLTKIKINIYNFHFICQNEDINMSNRINTILSIKIPTISFEPLLNENDQSKNLQSLRLLSISISLYNISDSSNIINSKKITEMEIDEFMNSINSFFASTNSEKTIETSLIFNDFTIFCLIDLNHELSEVKINLDPIVIKSKLNHFFHFINKNSDETEKATNLWIKTYQNFLINKEKCKFNIETALSFLKNRQKYVNLINSENDFEKVNNFLKETEINKETEKCLKFYSNEVVSEEFNKADQICSQINHKVDFSLSIPSIQIDLEDENSSAFTLKFDQLNGKYQFDRQNHDGTFSINDFFINGTKVSQNQPFLNSHDDTNGQIISLSNCLFVLNKEYKDDEKEKVDYLKLLDIDKKMSELKLLINLINLLGQSQILNHIFFLGNKRKKVTFNGQQCMVHLQYFIKDKKDTENLNEGQNISELPKFDFLISVNSYTIEFEQFKFKEANINFEGFGLNKNQMLLPLKMKIKLNQLMNSLVFSSELIELKMNGGYFKKSIDIFKAIQSVLNIKPKIDLIVKIEEIKIHLSVNLIMVCHNFVSKQKLNENQRHFSTAFNEFKILDCNRLFLSFESFKVSKKEIFINNLIFVLNAPALNYLFSLFSFDELKEKYKLIISNISVKLPFSEIVILALIKKIEYDGESKVIVDSFSAKSSQESVNNDSNENSFQIIDENSLYLIDPISLIISISYDENERTIINYHIEKLKVNFEQEEIKNLLAVFSFFKNFLISKNVNFESKWEFDLIQFTLRKPKSSLNNTNNVIACIELNSFVWEMSAVNNEFTSKIECNSILNSNDQVCKFLNCKSPICLSFKQVDKNVEAFITINDTDLFLSPELIMFNIDLYGISKLNIVNYEYVIHANNINISFYSNNIMNEKCQCDEFESFHLDEIRISSIKKGNFSFYFKNVKSLTKSFDLPSFELQMIDSVITYKMPDSCVQIETDSTKLEKFAKFFSEINLNLPSFLTFGIDLDINQIKIKLIDTNRTISISKLIFKLNASEKVAVSSLSEISYEGIFSLKNFKLMIHFHVDDPNSNKKLESERTVLFKDIDEISTDIDVKGDVLNPIHYEYINVLTKIENFTLTLKSKMILKFKRLFNYHFMKLFNKRNNKWIINEITLNITNLEQEMSFLFKNVDGYFSFNDKKFHLKINDADILPGNLLTKKTSEETFISIHYDLCDHQNNYLSILMKESVLKLDTNKFLSIYSLFDSINTLIPISLIVEKVLIIFDYENGSPFHIFLDFKISKNSLILYNFENSLENETAFEFESNVYSMNFVERKPLVQNMKLCIKIDNNRNLSFSISDCSFLLSLFVRELIKSLIFQIKKMSFLFEDKYFADRKHFLINSVKIETGKISIVFCKVSFQPSFRITFSPISTYFSSNKDDDNNDNNNKSFDVFTSIDFVNDKINDWDYLVEPFKLSIYPSLQIFKNEARCGVYHYLNVKVDVNKELEKENLNINLPLFLLQTDEMFDQEEKELFEKISKNNKLFELPDLFIKNNLNEQVTLNISPQKVYFIMVPQQLLPIYIDDGPSLFEIKVFDKTFRFTLDEIIYPTILSTSLSIVKRGRRIELNSPVQIQSCINRIVIDLYEKGEGEFNQIATLEPGKLFPLYFNSSKPKECLFIIENEKIKDKKHHSVLISPFNSEGDSSTIISDEHKNYYALINVDNDKSGKVVKLQSSVICQNLLPFSLFIRIKNHKNEQNEFCEQFPICKNDTVDLLSVNPEIGSKFYAELSMNGIDYSSSNKLIIELSPSKETSMRASSSMNFLLDLNSESSLKYQTMSIFDCRIEKEIFINVKFEKLSNGQIKMSLFSPFIFANLTDSDLMILNGNSVTHLPIHNWSVLAPKIEGFIFSQKDDKIVLSIDGYEKQEIQYNPPNKNFHNNRTYFQSLFLKQEDTEIQNNELQPRRKSSAFDSFINLFSKKGTNEENNESSEQTVCSNPESTETKQTELNKVYRFMPLRLKISKHKFGDETLEVVISDLITVQNDTDIQIDFEFISVSPHSTCKIQNIKKIHELSFHFNGSQIQKTISLDVLDNKNDYCDLNGSFRASFLIENDQKIEIDVINQEVNLLVVFKNSTFPTPLIITNELIDSQNQPITIKVYHTDPNKLLLISPFTTSPFYFDDLQNLESINAIFILPQTQQKKEFKISLLNETSITEISDQQNELNFFITVKISQEKQILKSVIFSSKVQSNDEKIYSNILNFFRFKIDLNIPSIMTSIIDLNMNEILLISNKFFSFSIDNTIDFDTFFTAFLNNNKLSFKNYGIQTICNFSIKSLQVDIQSSIIPRVFSPTIFKSNGINSKKKVKNDENEIEEFISVTFLANPINKYVNIYLCDSIDVSSDPLSLSFFMKIMNSLKHRISFGKFDWFEVSPFSFHFSYQETKSTTSDGSINKRRSSFSLSDVLNNNPKSTTVSIPGIVFGQFDGNFVNEVIQIYLNKYIKPTLASIVPSIQNDKDNDVVDDEKDIDIVDIDSAVMMTKKISENLTTSYGCINRSSLVSLALSLVNEKIKTPQMMINIIAGLTSYSKNVKKLRNGYIFYFNFKDKIDSKSEKLINFDRKNSDAVESNDNDNNDKSSNVPIDGKLQHQQQQWMRIPRCYPRFIIGIYDEDLSRILILIRNRFRNKERVRMISKCTVTNDVVVLTDSYLIIISPTLEFISNEISILEIQSVAVVESELRIAGKKESEKMMLRLDSEKSSKIFSIFIASQRLSLGMFGMSMIDK